MPTWMFWGTRLDFSFGLGLGWIYVYLNMPSYRGQRPQIAAAVAAVSLVCLAWLLALGGAAAVLHERAHRRRVSRRV